MILVSYCVISNKTTAFIFYVAGIHSKQLTLFMSSSTSKCSLLFKNSWQALRASNKALTGTTLELFLQGEVLPEVEFAGEALLFDITAFLFVLAATSGVLFCS